jgi:hypothetical protein
MSSVLYLVGPEEMGGHGDLGAKLEAAVKATGKPLPEIADSVYERLEGKVAKVPGVPDLYDYEYFPQEVRRHPRHGSVHTHMHTEHFSVLCSNCSSRLPSLLG